MRERRINGQYDALFDNWLQALRAFDGRLGQRTVRLAGRHFLSPGRKTTLPWFGFWGKLALPINDKLTFVAQ
jgi:hypothetical protein